MMTKRAYPGFKLAIFATLFAVIVVGLGVFTRLVDAGLGCPDWPGCYGHLLWPTTETDIVTANSAYPNMPVISGKPWPEMVHRYFAGTLGLLILALTIIAFKHRKLSQFPFRLPIFMLLLVGWQAIFGMWTVTLKLWPQVVSIHLLGGFTTLLLLTVLVQRLSAYRWWLDASESKQVNKLLPWYKWGVGIVVVQVALGGWVASNYAAFGCPPMEFPTCFASYWPEMDMAQGFNLFQGIGPNYLGGLMESEARTAIHYVHRIGALVVTLFIVGLSIASIRIRYAPLVKLSLSMLILLLAQIALGIGNVMLAVPLGVAVAHNLVGALLLVSVTAILTQSMMAQPLEHTER